MSDEGRVHPDCRNASNPYHECSEYCFKVIAELKARSQKNEPGFVAYCNVFAVTLSIITFSNCHHCLPFYRIINALFDLLTSSKLAL